MLSIATNLYDFNPNEKQSLAKSAAGSAKSKKKGLTEKSYKAIGILIGLNALKVKSSAKFGF